jgi:hypothetical protein
VPAADRRFLAFDRPCADSPVRSGRGVARGGIGGVNGGRRFLTSIFAVNPAVRTTRVENSFPTMTLDLRGLRARLNYPKSNLQGMEGGIQ